MFEFIEEPLDEVPLFVEVGVVRVGPSAIWPRGNDRLSALIKDRVVEVLGIVGAVGNHKAAGNAVDKRRAIQDLTAVARACGQPSGVTQGVGGNMELGGQSPFGPTKALGIRPPFSLAAPAAC